MEKKEDAEFQEAPPNDPAPPPYSEVAQGPDEPTKDLREDEAETLVDPTASPYRPFPPVLNAYYQWKMTKTFHLGESPDQRLYAASTHTGWGRKSTGPGIVLYNGATDKDPRLATVGEEHRMGEFSLNSVITLPSLPGSAQQTCTEIMRSSTNQKIVNFKFSIEVGHGKELHREEFMWQTVPKGDEAKELAEAPFDARFKLIRSSNKAAGSGESSSKEIPPGNCQETLAVFSWNRSMSVTKPFRIQFIGEGRTANMGERWAMMVAITGLRLWWLKHQGRDSPGFVASAEAGIVPGAVG